MRQSKFIIHTLALLQKNNKDFLELSNVFFYKDTAATGIYTKVKNAFIGLIMGEVVAVMAWNIFAAIRAFLGMVYYRPEILPK